MISQNQCQIWTVEQSSTALQKIIPETYVAKNKRSLIETPGAGNKRRRVGFDEQRNQVHIQTKTSEERQITWLQEHEYRAIREQLHHVLMKYKSAKGDCTKSRRYVPSPWSVTSAVAVGWSGSSFHSFWWA